MSRGSQTQPVSVQARSWEMMLLIVVEGKVRYKVAQCTGDLGGNPLLSVASLTSLSYVAMSRCLEVMGEP